jgi:serine/threonine protein kinase
MVRENASLKLLDFGIAAEFDTLKGGGLLEPALGYTENYASPEYRALFAEQINKMKAKNEPISTDLVGPKSDIYSVGVMIQFWLKKQLDSQTNNWPKDMPENIKAQYLILADIASRMTEFSVAKRMGAEEAIQELGYVAQSLK